VLDTGEEYELPHAYAGDTLNTIKNLQYEADLEHFWHALGVAQRTRSAWWRAIPEKVRRMILPVLRSDYKRLHASAFVTIEKHTGVPAEFLVNGARYYKRVKIAGYRALFEAYRQGMPLEKLTAPMRGEPGRNWYRNWHDFFKGKPMRNRNWLWQLTMAWLCMQRLGMTAVDFLRPPVRLTEARDRGALEVFELMGALDSVDLAFVGGVVKALSDHKLAGAELGGAVTRLLEWYYAKRGLAGFGSRPGVPGGECRGVCGAANQLWNEG